MCADQSMGFFKNGSSPQRRKFDQSIRMSGSRNFRSKPGLLSVLFFMVFFCTSAQARRSFIPDCSANHRLQCRAAEDSCVNNSRSDDYPGAPFDLRVSWFMVATTPGKLDTYQLWVNVSWKPTYERSINKTEGFELTILDKDTNRETCFTFNLDQPQWENKDRHTSIRFQFATIDVFEFGHNYYVEIHSLPKPSIGIIPKRNTFIGRETTMPIHPEQFLLEQLNRTGYFESSASQLESLTAHCSKNHISESGAHPQATKWLAAFRYVYIQPKAKFIFVDFVAAPPQFCFEEYELRLLRNLHEIVEVTRVRSQDLSHEIYGNVTVAFGNYTFHNVTPGVYEIGVIPIDHSAKDSRCLCPAFGRMCTCAQAIWPDVVMPDPPKPPEPPSNPCDLLPPLKLPFDCPTNTTKPAIGNEKDLSVTGTALILTCLLVGGLLLLMAGCLMLHFFCKRHKAKVASRIQYHLWPPSSGDPKNGLTDVQSGTEMTPILHMVKVLIIYSRDCPAHESAVQALGQYLRANCMCEVVIDSLCAKDIDANKFDWVYKSIVEADRVLLVNSYGAFMRYQAKLMADTVDNNTEKSHIRQISTIIERADPSPLDDLFLLQLDMITQFQHQDPRIVSKFISIRFGYSSAQYTLPHANPFIRYEIPAHFRKFMIDLHQLRSMAIVEYDNIDGDVKNSSIPPRLREVNPRDFDRSIEGAHLKKCIAAMERYQDENPDWFSRLHVRRPVVVSVPNVPKSPTRTNGYVITAVPRTLDEHLDPPISIPAGSSPPTKAESTTDSGFEEPMATTSSHDDYVDYVGIDPNECLLVNDDHCDGTVANNMDSCDSGIATDYLQSTSSSASAYDKYYSPKSGPRLNGLVRSPAKSTKLLDAGSLEARRLIS